MEKNRKFEIYLYTSLEESICQQIGIKKLKTITETKNLIDASGSILVLENPTFYIPG